MTLNVGDILAEIENAKGNPSKLYLILTHYRAEAFAYAREKLLKELIPLVCGSCMIGKAPVRNEDDHWRHVRQGESWACYADPILKLLEKLSCEKSPATAADAPSEPSSKSPGPETKTP